MIFKINNCLGDPTDILVKNAALVTAASNDMISNESQVPESVLNDCNARFSKPTMFLHVSQCIERISSQSKTCLIEYPISAEYSNNLIFA